MSASAPVRTKGYRRRAGGYYIMVLSVSMILMIIGLSALLAARIQHRGAEGGNDLNAASLYAQSAIDLGMHWIENDSAWRTSRGEGFWAVNQPIGEGRLTLEANDLGSNRLLESSGDTDAVLLTGTGFKGDARYKQQVTLTPRIRGLDCLEVALAAGGDLAFSSTLTCDQTVSANGSIIATLASGTSDLEALGTIDPGAILGTQTTLSDPRTLPDSSTVFDFYVANGTAIDIATIPTSAGTPSMTKILLSPSVNPYGTNATNSNGIYVIDCLGDSITIRDCRIVGTLVLRNTGPASKVVFSVNWEPAVPNYPALLVDGVMNLEFDSTLPLVETPPNNTNFNPESTPYEGAWDTLMDDSYPTRIKGLVYVSGAVDITNSPAFDGVVVVGGSLVASGNMSLTYQPTYFNDPPPGFAAPVRMIVSPASWKQVVN